MQHAHQFFVVYLVSSGRTSAQCIFVASDLHRSTCTRYKACVFKIVQHRSRSRSNITAPRVTLNEGAFKSPCGERGSELVAVCSHDKVVVGHVTRSVIFPSVFGFNKCRDPHMISPLLDFCLRLFWRMLRLTYHSEMFSFLDFCSNFDQQ